MNIEQLKKRLMKNSTVDPVSGCWNWTGKVNNSGYGQLTVRILEKAYPVNLYAHRLSMVVLKGARLRKDCHVDHKCRNPLCINPEHLRQVKAETNLSRRRFARVTCPRCGAVHSVAYDCSIGECA